VRPTVTLKALAQGCRHILTVHVHSARPLYADKDDSGCTYVGTLAWMTRAETAAVVCAPRVAALQRQCELLLGELEYRWLHEVQALLAGTALRAQRLQDAAQALKQPRSAAGRPRGDADELLGRAFMLECNAAQLTGRLESDQARFERLRRPVEATLKASAAAAFGAPDDASSQCSDVGSGMWDTGAAEDASDCSSVARLRQEELHEEQAMHEVLPELAVAEGHSAPPQAPAQLESTDQPLGRSVIRADVAQAAAAEVQTAVALTPGAEGALQSAAHAADDPSDRVLLQPGAVGALAVQDVKTLKHRASEGMAATFCLANNDSRSLEVGDLLPLLDMSTRSMSAWVSDKVLSFTPCFCRCVALLLITASTPLCNHEVHMLTCLLVPLPEARAFAHILLCRCRRNYARSLDAPPASSCCTRSFYRTCFL
jgi:hypothetical protein